MDSLLREQNKRPDQREGSARSARSSVEAAEVVDMAAEQLRRRWLEALAADVDEPQICRGID